MFRESACDLYLDISPPEHSRMHASFSILVILLLEVVAPLPGSCPTSSIFDAATISRDLYNMRTSPFGQIVISTQCDLECYDFDSLLTKACRWRNENNGCGGRGDELDFLRMRGRWGEDEGALLFAKNDSPDGFFLLIGTELQLPTTHSAMLVSDPIQCQEGDGIVRFRHWTSPGVKIRVCIRRPSMGKQFDWCSESVRRNGTKTAQVVIPGTVSYTFEIVIEAYNFVLDILGKKGGAAVIDDVSYNSSAIYNCRMIPHHEPLVRLPSSSCAAVQCDFSGGMCLKKIKGTGWKTANKAVGPRGSGVNHTLKSSFGYARGPGSYSFSLGSFSLPRPFALEFCYFVSSIKSRLRVYLAGKDREKTKIFESDPMSSQSQHWICRDIILANATYDYVEFSAEKLRNEHSYVGLDQISLVDPLKGVGACDGARSMTRKSIKLLH